MLAAGGEGDGGGGQTKKTNKTKQNKITESVLWLNLLAFSATYPETHFYTICIDLLKVHMSYHMYTSVTNMFSIS